MLYNIDYYFLVPMKQSVIENSRKRKQKTGLLKIVDSKKARLQHKLTTTARKQINHTDKVQTRFTDSFFYSNEQNHKHVSQQIVNLDANVNQIDINHCACLLCMEKSFEIFKQRKIEKKMYIPNKSLMFKNQQTSEYGQKQPQTTILLKRNTELKISHYNLNSMQALLVNLKPSTTVCDNFYYQNIKVNSSYISKHHVDTYTMQTEWLNVTQHYVQQSNAKNKTDFNNPFFQNSYHKNSFASLEQYLTFQGSTSSIPSSIESVGSDTNDLMTSQKFQMLHESGCYNLVAKNFYMTFK